ncbi:hypothetical protein [uncultured Deinococcus sp.]|uniref:DUF7482 domain-containing protein n=1 Tax=uncultured Deinococcus sp. TaxID=158789 RepID=UPI0025FCFB7E|nr:hypothetical protein [uncultured Deinococcus sp.]
MFRPTALVTLALSLAACGSVAPQPDEHARMMTEITALAAQAGPTDDLGAQSLTAQSGDRRVVFLRGREHPELDQITLPLYEGRSGGQSFGFVVTEASDRDVARILGVNYAPNLARAAGTAATQKATLRGGRLSVNATVDFRPDRVVTPGPGGFSPAALQPGEVGQAGYSPLIELPGGIVLNASHVSNGSGQHTKVVSVNAARHRVTLQETEGFYDGNEVYYVSLDASASDAAALEGVTLAPALDAAPGLNGGGQTARSGLALFINGQTGADNPQRQGLTSALRGEGSPLNVLEEFPRDDEYSPLWNVHVTVWTDAAVAAGMTLRQTDFGEVQALAAAGTVTAPGGGAWGPSGFIVNCPAVSEVRSRGPE